MEEKSIKRKPAEINQKVPISKIVPKKDIPDASEKRAERKNAKMIPAPPTKIIDLGKLILPSEKRAMAQKIIQTASPTTKSNPFKVSIGILVKGKKKNGNNTTTKNKERKEILSNIFDFINFIILYSILKVQITKRC